MIFCMSEADAQKKRCCRGLADTCLGSMCMAWRWVETNISSEPGELYPSRDTHGYCGLAGPPWNGK